LKGWNRKVRITSAIKSAWMTTRMVSPKPLSDFVPDVTLIAFPFPVAISRAVAEHFPHANRPSFRVEKMVLILTVRANYGANPNSLWLDPLRRFRRLFAAAQSMASSKLSNLLKHMYFFVFRVLGPVLRHRVTICRDRPLK
jgi:hypothetical protein